MSPKWGLCFRCAILQRSSDSTLRIYLGPGLYFANQGGLARICGLEKPRMENWTYLGLLSRLSSD